MARSYVSPAGEQTQKFVLLIFAGDHLRMLAAVTTCRVRVRVRLRLRFRVRVRVRVWVRVRFRVRVRVRVRDAVAAKEGGKVAALSRSCSSLSNTSSTSRGAGLLHLG